MESASNIPFDALKQAVENAATQIQTVLDNAIKQDDTIIMISACGGQSALDVVIYELYEIMQDSLHMTKDEFLHAFGRTTDSEIDALFTDMMNKLNKAELN